MGDPVVDGELKHLGVHQDQADLLGGRLVQQRQQHAVDAHGLPRPGGAGHQQVRHGPEIGHHRVPCDVGAQGKGQGGIGLPEDGGFQYLPDADRLPVKARDLQPDHGLAGDVLHHPDAGHGQGASDVPGQTGDLAGLCPRSELQLEPGHHRPRMEIHNPGGNPEIRQALLEKLSLILQALLPDHRPAGGAVQQLKGGMRGLGARLGDLL